MGMINWNKNYQTHENPSTTGTTYEQDGKMYNNNGQEMDKHGHVIEDETPVKTPMKPLESMTVAELKEVAARIPGARGVGRMTKRQLLEFIQNA